MKKYVRLPNTNDHSLKAWSAVDEHIQKHLEEAEYNLTNLSIFHDRFGYLTCNLIAHKPITITYLESQKQSISRNASTNWISLNDLNIISILEDIPSIGSVSIMKVPKSLDLFRLYLIKLIDILPLDGVVIAGFMTRHFTKAMLEIAAEYFDLVEQSMAWKKSRILTLSNPKKSNNSPSEILNSIDYNEYNYRQYLGVFSANHIDYATQFLLEHMDLRDSENSFLDIGCGNGIIGKLLIGQRKWNEAVMIDDSYLAIASTEMNLSESEGFKVIAQYNLDSFEEEQFDLVITNPPFHFEYEVDPSIAIQLMSDTYRILSNRGRLIIVANRHLNYKSQLSKYYSEVNIINENYKFIIYEALK